MANRYIDPHVSLKDADVQGSLQFFKGLPLFALVEFNIWGACNRRCVFCPVSDPEVFTNRKEGIALDDYEKVLRDLCDVNYEGVILWSMFSEPMLHKEIFSLAELTKSILPKVSLQFTTNGDSLKKRPEKLSRLLDAGVDRINMSLYDGPDQLKWFTELRDNTGLSAEQVKLRRRYQEGGNYGISISNRTGLIDSNKYRDAKEEKVISLPLSQPCFYPFYQVAIDYNGDVLLCPHDWGKKVVAGNAFQDSIWDIWKGEIFAKARRTLKQSCRDLPSCRGCDVSGDLIGRDNFEAFEKINVKARE